MLTEDQKRFAWWLLLGLCVFVLVMTALVSGPELPDMMTMAE